MFKRAKKYLSQPGHRTKYLVFILTSAVLALTSYIIKEPWQSYLLQFSVTFGAVAIIKIMWELIGGDPSEEWCKEEQEKLRASIDAVGSVVNSSLQMLQAQLKVVNDLITYNLGIQRIWPSRRHFNNDHSMGMNYWKRRICECKEISILSITLWTNWMEDKDFRDKLLKAISNGTTVTIIVYEPGSDIQKKRAEAEEDRNGDMINEIERTVKAVHEMQNRLLVEEKERLKIRYTYEAQHLVQIIRCDNQMLIAFYLHGMDGLSAPTIYVNGKDTHFYNIYSLHLNRLLDASKPA
jgi:hypothetical protein